MNFLRSTLALACAAALATTAVAQTQRVQQQRSQRPMGITDIMRAGPIVAVPPANARPPAAPQGQRAAEYIVALVNSEPITNTEVQKRVDRVLQDRSPELERLPRAQLTQQVLEQLISERAQLQLAKEQGVRADDTAVDQGIEEEGVRRVGLHGRLIGNQSYALPLGEADDLVHPVGAHLQLC